MMLALAGFNLWETKACMKIISSYPKLDILNTRKLWLKLDRLHISDHNLKVAKQRSESWTCYE